VERRNDQGLPAACDELDDNLSRKVEALPESSRANSPPQRIRGDELLDLLKNHQSVFSAPVWNEPTYETMKNRLSFGRAMDELGRLLKEENFTQETIKPVLTIMKNLLQEEPVVDLNQPPEKIRIALVDAVFDRFVTRQSVAYRDARGVQDDYRNADRAADSLHVALLGVFRVFMEQNPLNHVELLAELNVLRGEVEADTRGKNQGRL
jgi:hypothetical protein